MNFKLLLLTIVSVACLSSVSGAKKKQTNQAQVTCTGVKVVHTDILSNQRKRVIVMATFSHDDNKITLAKDKILQIGKEVIENWRTGRPSTDIKDRPIKSLPSNTEQTNKGIRLDRQVKTKKMRNYQLQINREFGYFNPSSIAEVQVQNGMAGYYENDKEKGIIVEAFRVSIATGGLAMLYQQEMQENEQPRCPPSDYLSTKRS